MLATSLEERCHREHHMGGTVTSISCGEESLPIQRIRSRHRGCHARASWWQNNRSIAQPAENFCVKARAIWRFPEKHWGVRCSATAFWSPCRHFHLGRRRGGNRITAVCSTSCVPYPEPDHRLAPLGSAIQLRYR